jgi:hypothetical protein
LSTRQNNEMQERIKSIERLRKQEVLRRIQWIAYI